MPRMRLHKLDDFDLDEPQQAIALVCLEREPGASPFGLALIQRVVLVMKICNWLRHRELCHHEINIGKCL